MTPTAKGILQLDEVLTDTYARHKEVLDNNNVIGMNCEDPATAPVGRHRRNFFLWLCSEYNIRNGHSVWIDLHPEDAPQWVRKVLGYIAEGYTEDVELQVVVSW